MRQKFTFEDGMAELEKLVDALEGGSMALEESFAAYERGIELAGKLKKILSEGDARIVALKAQASGGAQETDISGEVGEP